MGRRIVGESIGGTPANRMIHTPSQQLFIGPYAIDTAANVRVIPYDRVPGRPTGNAAHLTDPENRILMATMEAGFYDIDVHTLDAKTLYKDGNQMRREGAKGRLSPLLPGYPSTPTTARRVSWHSVSSIFPRGRSRSGTARIGRSYAATSSPR
ncbi:MAG: hypothetical protein BHV70_03240 [Bacteroidales bacterium 55_9]|nr:MAG: hypothetical protein BHV70_03240 [Bacteroidales bacterium 55_9]